MPAIRMKTIIFTTLLFQLVLLASCDPFHSLVVENKSAERRHLEVFLPKDGFYAPPDSVRLFKANPQEKQVFTLEPNTAVQNRDTAQNRYALVLPPGHRVLLEGGFGYRPYTERIVIDRTDTVVVNNKKSRVYKEKPRPLWGGQYKLDID